MGGDSSKINIEDVELNRIMSLIPEQKLSFQPPFRKFKSQYIKDIGKNTLCLVQMESPYEEHIEITQNIYKDLQQAFQEKTKNIFIQHVLFDELYYDRLTYLVKYNQKHKNITMRPFKSYDSHTFANILCQVNMNKRISELGSPYLQNLEDYYVIETGIQQQDQPNTQIMISQPADTTLSQIIKYRRDNKWPWSVSQFNFLINNMVTALHILHSNKIAHNDIRPSNIFYSSEKNCYFLGCFSNALNFMNNKTSSLRLRTSKAFSAPQLEQAIGYNMFETDVYALGMSLICAFYLYQPINLKGCAAYNRQFQDTYPFFNMIRSMVNPSPKLRMNSTEMFHMLTPSQNQANMKILIPSLKYKNSPKDQKLVKEKVLFSVACQRLGLWDEWKENLMEVLHLQENQLDEFNKANQLQKIAQVQYYMGQITSASESAKKAARSYRNLGYSTLEEGNLDYSISLFTKAVQSSKYFDEEDDYDYAKNLQGLSIAYGQKNQYQQSKLYLQKSIAIVKKCKGSDSGQCIQLKIALAKIQTQFREFEKSHTILEQCLNLTEKKSQINKNLSLKIKAQILQQIGKNYMYQMSYQPENKESFIQKGQQCFYEALKINQTLEGDNNIAISQNLGNIGEIQYKKKDFNTAKNSFLKALSLREQSINANDPRKDTNTKEKAQLLCHIANCQTSLKEYDKAMENFQIALDIYKKKFGSNRNFNSAIAIGNMGKVYKGLNDITKAKQCVKCAKDILADIRGTEDPDYQYFNQVEQLLNKKGSQ